jgi:cytochrome P450
MMCAWVDRRAAALAAAGGGELMAELADEYPIAVLCEVVGAPQEDIPRISALAEAFMRIFDLDLANNLPTIERAMEDLQSYVRGLIERRQQGPFGQDLISDLLRLEDQGDRLTTQELCDLIAAVIMAGTDTTRNQLGLAVLLLATDTRQWARLVADPGLAPRAVDEILRIAPAVTGTSRIAAEDIEYRDVTIPAGTYVYLVTAAANRDPAVVHGPTTADVTADRTPWAPLTFGGGLHYCLGANLARAELQEALAFLPARMPGLELDGEAELGTVHGIYGLDSLPVRWTSA